MQQSAVSGTRNGINALEMAYTGVSKIRQDVESTRQALTAGYKGSDGGAFNQLVNSWEDQADIILKNLRDMVDKLNETLRSHQLQQGSSNDQINQAYNQAAQVFHTLQG
jgi:uncharacterized protein YukE